MKLVPCPRCRQPAVGQKTPEYPEGAPVLVGRFTGGPTGLVVKCFRCAGSFKLDARTFAQLPEMTDRELKDWGLKGAGTTPAE